MLRMIDGERRNSTFCICVCVGPRCSASLGTTNGARPIGGTSFVGGAVATDAGPLTQQQAGRKINDRTTPPAATARVNAFDALRTAAPRIQYKGQFGKSEVL